ncbi:MAG: hypothetical protein CMO81_06300 [Waddliaceae bacterium]|nr:hypothetical protein [Waddliaceae bacterium]
MDCVIRVFYMTKKPTIYFFIALLSVFTIDAWSCERVQSPQLLQSCNKKGLSIFLAGTVSNSWRNTLMDSFQEDPAIFLIPINDWAHENDRSFRVTWEQQHIDEADLIVLWLAPPQANNPRTLSLTTLFELGRIIEMKDKPVIIGIHPNYPLRRELEIQLACLGRRHCLVDSVEEIALKIQDHLSNTDLHPAPVIDNCFLPHKI